MLRAVIEGLLNGVESGRRRAGKAEKAWSAVFGDLEPGVGRRKAHNRGCGSRRYVNRSSESAGSVYLWKAP
jgi:hypothetical protein